MWKVQLAVDVRNPDRVMFACQWVREVNKQEVINVDMSWCSKCVWAKMKEPEQWIRKDQVTEQVMKTLKVARNVMMKDSMEIICEFCEWQGFGREALGWHHEVCEGFQSSKFKAKNEAINQKQSQVETQNTIEQFNAEQEKTYERML